VRSRPINPKLWDVAKKEFERLCKYNYQPSTSPWASPLVTASKNTPPFVRFCGDYRWVNPHLVLPQAYIPRVQYEIEKASTFSIFMDIDMTNAFHQFPLAPLTSQRLAIQTPWGLVEPRFLPEGVSPASGHLQSMMMKMFGDFEAWSIVIFDNVLLLAHDEDDACAKLKMFLERCDEHNVFLKMSKSWFGFPSVKFFGYKISKGKYEMDVDRKKAIMEFEMPNSQKSMQRFLGAALFFKSFVANYSDVAAKLHKMTHKDFNWDKRTWTDDYKEAFEKMKQSLVTSVALFFPDYELPWILRVDASDVAVGAVLCQIRTDKDGNEVFEPIGFASKKFSETAMNWDPFKKEAYAAYFGVNYFAYYLRGKAFILETDHRNLLWIEKSEVPMVVRWRLFMQSFCMYVRHIPGTKNMVADWLSRMVATLYGMSWEQFVREGSKHAEVCCLLAVMIGLDDCEEERLMAVDPYRPAEARVRGQDLPDEDVEGWDRAIDPADLFGDRPEFQKEVVPEEQQEGVQPEPEVQPEPDVSVPVPQEAAVPQQPAQPVDTNIEEVVQPQAVAPAAPTRLWTAEEMFSEVHGGRSMHWGARRTWLALNKRFPGHRIPYRWIEEKVAECSVCQLYRRGFENYLEEIGTHLKPPHSRARVGFDGLTITPPDAQGNTHLIVIVDHFKKYAWGWVAKDYSAISIATALFVYYCTFGVFDEVYTDPGSNILSEVVEQLNKWLQVKHVVSLVDRHESNGVEGTNKQILRHVRTIVHDLRIKDRWSDPIILCLVFFVINDQVNSETGVRPLDAMFGSADGPYLRLPREGLPADITNAWVVALDADLKKIRQISKEYQDQLVRERTQATPEETQNQYQPGDLVFFRRDTTMPLPTKLSGGYTGPWEVIKQHKNVVFCKHLAVGIEKPLHVSRLKLHVGSKESAMEVAMRDKDQYLVKAITAWKGDPNKRSKMKFWVQYDDGDEMWVSYKADLVDNEQYREFVARDPRLFQLRYSAAIVHIQIDNVRKTPIVSVAPGDRVYVDLRYIKGHEVFDKLGLPNAYFTEYVCECSYVRWVGKTHHKIEAK